jgi:hypothetical protein
MLFVAAKLAQISRYIGQISLVVQITKTESACSKEGAFSMRTAPRVLPAAASFVCQRPSAPDLAATGSSLSRHPGWSRIRHHPPPLIK